MSYACGRQDWLYGRVKEVVLRELEGHRVDLMSIADRHRVSVTPVREVLYRLMGEGLVAVHPEGGFARVRPDATALAQLYFWNGEHVLAIAHMLAEPLLRRTLSQSSGAVGTDVPAGTAAAFRAIAAATGNAEFRDQVDRANDRLLRPRAAECLVFADGQRELAALLTPSGDDARAAFRRRVRSYHRRRVEASAAISALAG